VGPKQGGQPAGQKTLKISFLFSPQLQALCGGSVNSYPAKVLVCFEFELPREQPCWFALSHQRAEDDHLLIMMM